MKIDDFIFENFNFRSYVVWDDLELSNDDRKVTKYEENGWWFDSQMWDGKTRQWLSHVLMTWTYKYLFKKYIQYKTKTKTLEIMCTWNQ